MNPETFPFYFKNGELHCEEVHVENFFDSFPIGTQNVNVNGQIFSVDIPPTPAFVYSSAALKSNATNYLTAIRNTSHKCILGYAVKANGNQSILKSLRENGVEMLVTVSGNEILAGIEAGFAPNKIILNGNGKQEWEIKLAIKCGVLLNVDSIFDANRITEVKKNYFADKEVKVLLRIRPSVLVHKESTVHPYVNTAEASKFGFGMTELDQVLEILGLDGKIKVHGIHCHLGSCIYDPEVYRCMGEIMLEMTNELKRKGHPVEVLDIGGGIGINYHRHIPGVQQFLDNCDEGRDNSSKKINSAADNSNPDLQVFMDVIADIVPKNITLILEPGRSMIANTGIVVCKVLGTKSAGDKRYAVVDASMSEVIRPCLYNAYHQIYPTTMKHGVNWTKYDVVGPICETADFIGRDILLQELKSHKYLAVMDVGAYCSSMSSNYNMRPRPAEILVDGASWKCIRERDTYDDLMSKTRVS